ncbi:MAG: T9SS type A sorting domain-containing protein, partial [Bacteroidetes bacterium]|nr:T9SS type A sorting domain-containing protein [Bacteroidota bacterium]
NTSNVSYPLNSWFWDSRNILAGGQYSILWSTGDTIENISVAPNIDSQYTVTINDGITMFFDTININVLGNSLSISPFLNQLQSGSLASFTASTSDPNPSYVWQTDLGVGFQNLSNAGQYSGVTTDTLTVSNVTMSNNNQNFRCIVSSGSCSDTSNVAVLTVNNNVGINETSQDKLFSVFPNPAQSVINVKADGKLIGSVYSIYDNTGRVVLSGKLIAESTTIELGNLSGGIYMFSVGENMKQSFKVIKE